MRFINKVLIATLLQQLLFVHRANAVGFEVWASDQSNTSPNLSALGIKGGFLWIWDSEDIQSQLKGGSDAKPLPCSPVDGDHGPCNTLDMFPQDLQEYDKSGTPTGKTLGSLTGFGRIHGVVPDPAGLYLTANFYAPNGGFVGIIDAVSKEAIGLFRATQFTFGNNEVGRSVHMSYWSSDGAAIVIANLNGKAIERIEVQRDENNRITNLSFNQAATLGLGSSMSVVLPATVFRGLNAHSHELIGDVIGSYSAEGLGDLTPNGVCKENGCASGPNGSMGGRANNLPICPIPSSTDHVFTTLAGGGLLVADMRSTPMRIVGEYGNNAVYGAGCGGVQVGDTMFLNAGVATSPAGATQSMFGVFAIDIMPFPGGSNDILTGSPLPQNTPQPVIVYEDPGNTLTLGNPKGNKTSDLSGQLPSNSTRRDSHGMAVTTNGLVLHVADRIQNVIETFDVATFQRFTYDLTSVSGLSNKQGALPPGACFAKSITDDPQLPRNDPAPDLFGKTPDGKYLMVALRGPTPITVTPSAQGSCPGVGVVELFGNGKFGKLVSVLRTTNLIPDTLTTVPVPGGVAYIGKERSDVHGAIVVPKQSA